MESYEESHGQSRTFNYPANRPEVDQNAQSLPVTDPAVQLPHDTLQKTALANDYDQKTAFHPAFFNIKVILIYLNSFKTFSTIRKPPLLQWRQTTTILLSFKRA